MPAARGSTSSGAPTSTAPLPPGFEWVAIDGGAYRMGTTIIGKRGYLTHLEPFDMAKTEVTVEQYAACVKAGHCTPAPGAPSCTNNNPKHPVTCVTWAQAQAFSRWVGGRLPSEAEWQWAAASQGTQAGEFVWGDAFGDCTKAHTVGRYNARGCGTRAPAEPCSKAPDTTRQGLCDMAGNVQEWVADEHLDVYPPRDGSPNPGKGEWKVVRGGSYMGAPMGLAHRDRRAPTVTGNIDLGFRPVRATTRRVKPIKPPAKDLLQWVQVPKGSFELEGRRFTVPAFEMGRTEVTLGQYEACIAAGACLPPTLPRLADPADCNWGPKGQRDAPINCVTWTHAARFAEWADARLPSTTEWVLALRGATPGPFPWGDAPATCALAVTGQGGPGCGTGRAAPVCSRPKDVAHGGICDLAGNVSEWAADSASLASALPLDGSPGRSNRAGGGVLGADFTDANPNPARRGGMHDIPAIETGFRLARDVPPR